jgi:bisphosphoglycerate-dependent phosphoglycerate mutase
MSLIGDIGNFLSNGSLAGVAYNAIKGSDKPDPNNPYGINNYLSQRQDYQISPELTQAFNLSQNNALGESDIQSKLENAANRTEGQQLNNNSRYATSGSEAQLGANQAVQNYGANLDNAAIAGSQQKQQNLAQYYGLSGELANQQQTQYGYNQQYPLEQRLAFASALAANNNNKEIAQNTSQNNLLGSLIGALA